MCNIHSNGYKVKVVLSLSLPLPPSLPPGWYRGFILKNPNVKVSKPFHDIVFLVLPTYALTKPDSLSVY